MSSKFNRSCDRLHLAIIDVFGNKNTMNPMDAITTVTSEYERIKMDEGEYAAHMALIHSYVMAIYRNE